MNEPIAYGVPVPSDLNSIKAIHDGSRWISGVLPGTTLDNGVLFFAVDWSRGNSIRHFALATDVIAGYQTV